MTQRLITVVDRSERLLHLDVLRGFALFGILLVNFEWFVRPLQAIATGAEPGLAGADLVADVAVRVLAEGKFYPLFSMLFGAGFALMFERARARHAPFWGLYLRRLFLLMLFGLGHMLLVWAGDILLVYSLTGFVMVLFFRNTPTRRLWKWALAFIVLPVLLIGLMTAAFELARFDPALAEEIQADMMTDHERFLDGISEAAVIMREGSYLDNVAQRLRDMRFTLSHAFFWVPPILGFFLIGRWLIVTGRLTQPDQHRMYFRRWRSRGLLLGLPAAGLSVWLLHGAVMTMPSSSLVLGMALATAAGVMLSLAYLSMVILGADRLKFLAPAGQMALSNYLMQSLLWTWILYGHGLGMIGYFSRSAQVLGAIVFFAGQLLLSHWWMGRFRLGPAEWLWRSLTYWKLQPLSRD